MNIIEKIFGTHSENELKRIYPIVDKIEALGPEMEALSDEELRGKTREFKERLKEDDIRGGAFYCSLPSFRDSYRLVSRIIERNGQSVYLMLCSITNGKGMPMDKPDKLEVLSGELQNTIQQCLRKGDSFTKYSPSQFLILLVGTNKENCSMIFDRIQRYFSREHKSWKQYLDYFVSSVAEVDRQDSPIQFNTENKTW